MAVRSSAVQHAACSVCASILVAGGIGQMVLGCLNWGLGYWLLGPFSKQLCSVVWQSLQSEASPYYPNCCRLVKSLFYETTNTMNIQHQPKSGAVDRLLCPTIGSCCPSSVCQLTEAMCTPLHTCPQQLVSRQQLMSPQTRVLKHAPAGHVTVSLPDFHEQTHNLIKRAGTKSSYVSLSLLPILTFGLPILCDLVLRCLTGYMAHAPPAAILSTATEGCCLHAIFATRKVGA